MIVDIGSPWKKRLLLLLRRRRRRAKSPAPKSNARTPIQPAMNLKIRLMITMYSSDIFDERTVGNDDPMQVKEVMADG